MKKIPPQFAQAQACEIPRWQELKTRLQNHTPAEFKVLLEEEQEGILLDVRTTAEAEAQKLDGATMMDYLAPDFLDKMDSLDKEKRYLIYCQSGRRSVRTCTMMTNAGFKQLHHLDGGLNAWNNHFSIV